VVSIAMLVLGLVLGGGAAVYVFHSPLGDQIREIWENARNPGDDSEFIAEPKERLGFPCPSLTRPLTWPLPGRTVGRPHVAARPLTFAS
jgi:hypothetical protein